MSKILYDNETVIKYADELSYDFSFFEYKNKIGRYLPDLSSDASNLKKMFNIYKDNNRQSGSISEWIVDNYYLLEKQIKCLKLDFEGVEKEKFPILSSSVLKNRPRVFALAYEFIGHRQGIFEEDLFLAFINNFQKKETLNMKEISLLPMMLKITLIHYLSNIIVTDRNYIRMKSQAKKAKILFEKDDNYKSFLELIYDKKFSSTIENGAFLEEFTKLLDYNQKNETGYKYFLKCLKRKSIYLDEQIRIMQTEKAKNQMIVANLINSIRYLSSIPWDGFIAKSSVVDKTLNKDMIYKNMDHESKRHYKNEIEKLAFKFNVPEVSIVNKLIELSVREKKHLGFYLFKKEKSSLYLSFFDEYRSTDNKHANTVLYICLIVVPTIIFSVVVSKKIIDFGYDFWLAVLAFITSLIPFFSLTSAIVNRVYGKIFNIDFIPRLSLDYVSKSNEKTMVITPCLISNKKSIDKLIKSMEVNYLSNRLDNICFAIIADFKASNKLISEQELEIIRYAKDKINRINNEYGCKLLYFHARKRVFDNGKYIAWERKRGAVIDFCQMISSRNVGKFYTENHNIPDSVEYIITIDSDTQITRESASKLIGAMMHPLNKPVLADDKSCVIDGYALITPSIGVDIEDAVKSRFSLIFADNAGLDSYSSLKSNIYQDVFGSAIFSGKGIFHLDTFTKVLENAFHDKRVLSHDFLEGHYLRTGFSSDVVFMDGYPNGYMPWCERQHRWVRGDWQQIPWLLSHVKNKHNAKVSNPLNLLNKFQIIDNLIRSILPISISAIIFMSVTVFAKTPFLIIVACIVPYFFDSILSFAVNLVFLIKNRSRGATLKDALLATENIFYKTFYKFVFLPYEAYLMFDAIIRSLYRVLISKSKLLEWKTAQESSESDNSGYKYYIKKMWIAPILSLVLILANLIFVDYLGLFSFSILCAWASSPIIANYISINYKSKAKISDYAYMELNVLSRRTYKYFHDYCKYENYYFAPDNVQGYPKKEAVNRTSPTNIGFSLSSFYSGYLFGYIPYFYMLDRIERIVCGIERAEKYEGHMFNWYDIENNIALNPKYVSAVDSGNLACYLVLTIKALENSLDESLYNKAIQGIYFTLINEVDNVDDEIVKTLNIKSQEKITTFELYKHLKYLNKTLPKYMKNFCKSEIKASIDYYLSEFNNYYPYIEMLENYNMDGKDMHESLNSIKNSTGCQSINGLIDQLPKQIKGLNKLKEITSINYDVEKLISLLDESNRKLIFERNRIVKLRNRMAILLYDMDFSKLYDKKRNLFYIGYDYTNHTMSESHYDLLASEARQTAIIAIAKGDVPTKHWFKLSRPVTISQERRILLSWSGTMFEYLMPFILMKNYSSTLINETYKGAVDTQITYGKKKSTPWGISESGYYDFDFDMFYQYKAFGVPRLSLKYNDDDNIVVAPYSTILALGINANESLKNYKTLKKLKVFSEYGLYEAIDFAKKKNGKRRYSIVKSYMAHHQGMILASLTNYLFENKLQNVFHSSKIIMSTEQLLKEKSLPRNLVIENYNKKDENIVPLKNNQKSNTLFDLNERWPQVHILSNGKYSCLITQFGTGYSKFKNLLLNTWSNDYLNDVSGNFIYINDRNENKSWSMGYAPTFKMPDQYSVNFSDHKASIYRKDDDVSCEMNICISPDSDLEIRKLVIKNDGQNTKNIDIVSLIIPMLCSIDDYISHPAFASLFLEKVDIELKDTIIFRKRARDEKRELFLGFKCIVDNGVNITRQCKMENVYKRLDKFKNINFDFDEDVQASVNAVLALKVQLDILKGAQKEVCFITSACEDLPQLICNLNSVKEMTQVDKTFYLAKTASIIKSEYNNISYAEKEIFHKILSHVIFSFDQKGVSRIETTLKKDRLFRYGLNEKSPYIIAIVKKATDLKRIQLLIKAFDYFRKQSIPINLVLLDCSKEVYLATFKEKINKLIHRYAKEGNYYTDTKIVFISEDSAQKKDIDGLLTCSNIIVDTSKSIIDQLSEYDEELEDAKFERNNKSKTTSFNNKTLNFSNGFGGFSNNGNKYVITYKPNIKLPSPWVNVLANEKFGSVISSESGGYTWAYNSRLFRITPFKNQAFNDNPSEGIYVRDNKYGQIKNLMPDNMSNCEYLITHGKGYSTFESKDVIYTKLKIFVPNDISAKIMEVNLVNDSSAEKQVSVMYYFEPVLGEENFWKKSIYTKNLDSRAITATNLIYNEDFIGNAYVTSLNNEFEYTSDKFEVFSQESAYPKILDKSKLSNSVGVCSNACIAIKISKVVKPYQTEKVVIVCGFEKNNEDILATINKLEVQNCVSNEFNLVKQNYDNCLGKLQIKTPEKSFDYMINSWLLYQTINSRLLGKSGYYQSGGAFGFRDQLQDVLSMLYLDPIIVKNQIVKCSKRQFVEGDVLHWWHKQATGVRTKISDDLLFLPYVLSEYILATNDYSILDEQTNYLQSIEIPKHSEDVYADFQKSEICETLYMHAMRAINHANQTGSNGLLLIKGGDWNDGMNKVGTAGRGESVWLTMFYYDVISRFIELAQYKGDLNTVNMLERQCPKLKKCIDNAWDGKWYRRGYYDNGDPLGSQKSDECKIDLLSQSWSIISQSCDLEKCKMAFDSAHELLLDEENGIIKLLTPAFSKSKNNPGYIKSYLKGVRENGGQYTHAAAWYILSATMLGKNETAYKMFDMINPINLTKTKQGALKYKGEPYVVAGDVYSACEAGRAGWTWYTGSANWLYRAGVEYILGFKKRGDHLYIKPCIPNEWNAFSIRYKYRSSIYVIDVTNKSFDDNYKQEIILDNELVDTEYIELFDDGKKHIACITLI